MKVIERPIIIATVPRSGSSLIASIFAAHGVWVGRHLLKTNMGNTPEPYPSFENADLDLWFKGRTKYRRLIDLVQDLVPHHQPWLYKCSPWKAAMALAELEKLNPLCVKVRRDADSIMKSSGPGKAARRRHQLAELSRLPGPVIDADAVMARDFESLSAAFDYCGLTLGRYAAEQQINDQLWHHKKC